MGDTLVMGRATYDSIGRPLPGRTTIVVTRDPDWSADGVLVAHSLDEALALAAELAGGDLIVVGGTQIYAAGAAARRPTRCSPRSHLSPDGDALLPGVRPSTSGSRPAASRATGLRVGLVGASLTVRKALTTAGVCG